MQAGAAGAAVAGLASFNPWTAVALGGASLLEAILGGLFKSRPPKEVRKLTKEVAGKGREILAHPGFDQATLDAIFGKNFENVRTQGKNVRESTTGTLGRAGMLGTGAEVGAARENAWSNEALVTEAMRDLLITGEAKKSSDIALATQMLGASSGAAYTGAAQGQQGQGPALTEMLMMAMMMGKGKGKTALDTLGGEGLSAYEQLMNRTNWQAPNAPSWG